mmetsp:Transcript_7064/g.14186  ORF Transcript_7064/g.14186 Transcript_7064/m.14186 type:complete len:320 (-) Transcript_7064:206-1165(-)|eukprot:CAMPEP_0171497594 /NCGR_PEP_ID=MMETSP0958-20121227/7362_1 /TAXON_ID=87120 /ORGANISM="Aurantiochytrium limacinum, Strain ATCCMYA-1381" /LENGTH=319 /DNA_ID=CAMNT_0012031861 /DNA_START=337 /DNA_END=1296 /DNA_ORIENTATION=-
MGGKKSKPASPEVKPDEQDGGPRKCSKCYLLSLNSFMIAAGIVMISLSAWLGVEYKGLSDLVSATVIWTPLGLGFGLIFVGLLGFFGALYQNRCSLCLYILFSAVLLLGCMILSIFLFVEIGNLEDVADVRDSNDLTDNDLQEINTFESVLFNKCCYDKEDEYGEMSYEVAECPCTTSTNAGCECYNDEVVYNYQLKNFDTGYCSVFSSLDFYKDGVGYPIVGNVDDGGCGGGDPSVFQTNIALYAKQSLKPGAAAILIVSIVMLVGVFLACFFFLLPKRSKKYDKMPPPSSPKYGDEEFTEADRLSRRDDHEGMIQMT